MLRIYSLICLMAAAMLYSSLCYAEGALSKVITERVFAPDFAGTKIPFVRSKTSTLPESIHREAFATIDRARSSLVELQSKNGVWITDSGEETVLPALALFDGLIPSPFYAEKLAAASSAANNWLKDNAAKPWTLQQIKEATFALNLLSLTNAEATIHKDVALAHLKSISKHSLSELDPIGKYFLLITLAQYNELSIDCFDTIIREQASINKEDLLAVEIIGIARLMRRNKEIPENDAKAYLRFLANKLQLGYHNSAPGENEILTPSIGFLTMIFASSFSNRQLAMDSKLFPYDWRNHLANRIIASQIYCSKTFAPYWEGNSDSKDEQAFSRTSRESLEATTLAIITLSNLAN